MKFEERITPISAFVPQIKIFDCAGAGSWGSLVADLSHRGLTIEFNDLSGDIRICVDVDVKDVETAEAVLAWFETDKKGEVPTNGLRKAANVVSGKIVTGLHDTEYFCDEPGETDCEFYLYLIWDGDSQSIKVTVWNRDFNVSKAIAEGLIANFFAELKRLGVVGDR